MRIDNRLKKIIQRYVDFGDVFTFLATKEYLLSESFVQEYPEELNVIESCRKFQHDNIVLVFVRYNDETEGLIGFIGVDEGKYHNAQIFEPYNSTVCIPFSAFSQFNCDIYSALQEIGKDLLDV